MGTPIIVDCDPGLDDAIALLLAAGSPDVDLLGITTVGGNGDLADVTANALAIASLAGLDVPVAAGEDGPLAGGALERAGHVHGPHALGGDPLPPATLRLDGRHAVALLRDLLLDAPAPVTLVPIGPLTNIALLLREHPRAAQHVGEIVLMGGSRARGNARPYAEFNILADPEAAELVFAAGLPLRMLGLDITYQALADETIRTRMRDLGTPIGRHAASWMEAYAEAYRRVNRLHAPAVHDPVAVAAVIDPTLIAWDDAFVAVETAGRWTRGATVVDDRLQFGQPVNAQVGATLDQTRFWELVLAAMARLGAATGAGA